MRLNRRIIHHLLVDFNYNVDLNTNGFSYHFSRFDYPKVIKQLIQFRGKNNNHYSDDLNDGEIQQLITIFKTHVDNNYFSDLSQKENMLVHTFATEYLLMIELMSSNFKIDSLAEFVNYYYYKFHTEMIKSHDYKALLQNSNVDSALQMWLQHFTNYPLYYIDHIFIAGHGNEYRLGSLDIDECGCVDISHDRLFGDLRMQVEDRIVEACKQAAIKNDDNSVHILSLGPGGGLQEFILILRLLREGINNIEITLVELKYSALLQPKEQILKIYERDWQDGRPLPEKYYSSVEGELYNIINAISILNRCFPTAKINISVYASAKSLSDEMSTRESTSRYDVLYAMDLEHYENEGNPQPKNDFYLLGSYLKPTGNAFVSSHYKVKKFRPNTGSKNDEITQDKPVRSDENFVGKSMVLVDMTQYKPIQPSAEGEYKVIRTPNL